MKDELWAGMDSTGLFCPVTIAESESECRERIEIISDEGSVLLVPRRVKVSIELEACDGAL